MCAQYTVKTSVRDIQVHIGLTLPADYQQFEWDQRVVPFSRGPVLVKPEGDWALKEMRFHLTPRWSKTEKVKWATYNARLETVDEKASFRTAFREKRCAVILSEFIEPIYEGEFAGHMVRFADADQKPLLAAGIYDEWVNPETGEILESFSIITDEPDPYIAKMGHDRQPRFTTPEGLALWLDPKPRDAKYLKRVLLDHKSQYGFTARVDRPLKPGWESRK